MPPSRAVDPALAGAGLGVAAVVLLALAVSSGVSDAFDRAAIETVRSPASATLLAPLRPITELGSTWTVTAVAIVTLAVGVLVGPWLHGLIGAITIGIVALANSALKDFMARARPDVLEPIVEEHGFSFPSGHSILGTVAWGILGVLVWRSRLPLGVRRAVVAALGLVIFLVGLSRVWLGVHYPTDVLAGWTAGAVIVLLFARLSRRVSPEPAAEAVRADPATPRSDPPAAG
jgi:undecaprenyl-diphosphatase